MVYGISVAGAVDPLTLSGQFLPSILYTGNNFSLTLSASGGVAPYTWSVTAGTLPPGVNLSQDGIFSGTPTATGTYAFTISVADHQVPSQTVSAQYTTKVGDPMKLLSPAIMPDACLAKPYSFAMQYSGGIAPISWISFGDSISPTGITFNYLTGVWGGTPMQTGAFNASVNVYDANQRGDHQDLTLTIKNCQ
jgi:hypothetical protein